MEGAAQAAVFKPAKGEVRAAMRTIAIHQSVTALLVAEQNEALAQQLDRSDRPRAFEFVNKRCRLPVHPQQFAGGIGRACAGDQIVLLLAHHGSFFLPVPRRFPCRRR